MAGGGGVSSGGVSWRVGSGDLELGGYLGHLTLNLRSNLRPRDLRDDPAGQPRIQGAHPSRAPYPTYPTPPTPPPPHPTPPHPPPTPTPQAIIVSPSLTTERYRAGFDLPFPRLPSEAARRVRPEALLIAAGKRQRLLAFTGECAPNALGRAIAALHDGREVLGVFATV